MVIIFTQCDCTYRSFLIFLYSMAMVSASVAEWLRAWDTLIMFEATVCGRS